MNYNKHGKDRQCDLSIFDCHTHTHFSHDSECDPHDSLKAAREKEKCTPQENAVIGDRIYTDIKSGLNAGALSVLVMSGETTPEILEKSADKPDIVLENAGQIM